MDLADVGEVGMLARVDGAKTRAVGDCCRDLWVRFRCWVVGVETGGEQCGAAKWLRLGKGGGVRNGGLVKR